MELDTNYLIRLLSGFSTRPDVDVDVDGKRAPLGKGHRLSSTFFRRVTPQFATVVANPSGVRTVFGRIVGFTDLPATILFI